MIDLTMQDEARERYQDLLKEAQAEGRALRVSQGRLMWWSRIVLWTSELLISGGRKLKARYQPAPISPAWRAR